MHSRKTPRAQRYDYTSPWWYFVTICTKDREHYFGKICRDAFETRPNSETIRSIMQLNTLGQYCHDEIARLSQRKTVDIHERIVMPNHVHLLLYLSEFTEQYNIWYTNRRDAFETRPNEWIDQGQTHTINNSSIAIGHASSMSLQKPSIIQHDNYQWPRLWQIIGTLKSNITKYANQHDLVFAWQGRYHDHIIRNEQEFERIKYYIQTNPENRNTDTLMI